MNAYYDIVVVGAGPSGSIAASFAALQGVSVLLLEKDRDVGYPVRCGEAVNRKKVTEFIEPDPRWIATTINKFCFVAPNKKEVIIEFEDEGYILERRIFDYELAKLAANNGAEVVTRAYVNGLVIENDIVCGVKVQIHGEEIQIKSKIVIAADGVESRVGRWAGLKTHIDFRDMESCVQITATNINDIDPNTCYFYLGNQVAPNGYLWVFPKGKNTANIGLGVSGSIGKTKSANSFLEGFLTEKYPNVPYMTRIAGGVPCSITLDKIAAKGIMLVGDSARQVNPLSGGGITSGMIAGSIAGELAGKSIRNSTNNLFDFNYINEYHKLWHQRVGSKHETYNRIKEGIYNFNDETFNSIGESILKLPKEKRTLGRIFTTALFNKPSLLIDVAKVFI